MSLRTLEEPIMLGERVIEIDSHLARPDKTLIAEHSGQLVVARYLDEQGGLAERTLSCRYDMYPTAPEKPANGADEMALQAYEEAMAAHRAAVSDFISAARARAPQPVPPIVGHIDISTGNPDYFFVQGLNNITSALPYQRAEQSMYPYRIHTARMV